MNIYEEMRKQRAEYLRLRAEMEAQGIVIPDGMTVLKKELPSETDARK